jgi:2-oxo-4-hydroxy-4-carboxy-5-ureidoimidazoline decarboxylase
VPYLRLRSRLRWAIALGAILRRIYLHPQVILNTMNPTLARWNTLSADEAAREVLPCCGSEAWARDLAAARPIPDEATLLKTSTRIWNSLPEADWQQAFDSHPRIGQQHARSATAQSLQWSSHEQSTLSSDEATKHALAEANRRYEDRFNRIFLICATGKSTPEILTNIELRMCNDPATELLESAEQQNQITHLRLQRWLNP